MSNRDNKNRSGGSHSNVNRSGSSGRVKGAGNNPTKGGYKPNSGGKTNK